MIVIKSPIKFLDCTHLSQGVIKHKSFGLINITVVFNCTQLIDRSEGCHEKIVCFFCVIRASKQPEKRWCQGVNKIKLNLGILITKISSNASNWSRTELHKLQGFLKDQGREEGIKGNLTLFHPIFSLPSSRSPNFLSVSPFPRLGVTGSNNLCFLEIASN